MVPTTAATGVAIRAVRPVRNSTSASRTVVHVGERSARWSSAMAGQRTPWGLSSGLSAPAVGGVVSGNPGGSAARRRRSRVPGRASVGLSEDRQHAAAVPRMAIDVDAGEAGGATALGEELDLVLGPAVAGVPGRARLGPTLDGEEAARGTEHPPDLPEAGVEV